MAFHTYATGDRPTAAQWNDWVGKRVVADATSATRPASPSEGQPLYETDTDRIQVYDGSAWQQVAQLGSWTTFTPSWTATSDPVIGNGTLSGRYVRLSGRTYLVQYKITAGSTTTFGSGQMKLSLPNSITASTYHAGAGLIVVAATTYTALLLSESTYVLMYSQGSILGAVTATQPGTWATGNYMYASIVVESTT